MGWKFNHESSGTGENKQRLVKISGYAIGSRQNVYIELSLVCLNCSLALRVDRPFPKHQRND